MTTTGRIIVVVVAAAALLTLTVLAMHYLRPPDVPPPAGPEVVETPAAAGGPGDSPAAPPPASAIAADLKSAHGPDAPPAPAGSAEAAADDGLAMAASGRVIQAQVRLSQALRAGLDGPKGKAVRETLVSLANRVQLSSARLPDDPYSKSYEVARGDSVTRIGSKFLIPLELVMKLNGLASPGINAGQSLKVLQGPVNVEIFKERHELQAWIGDVCIRIYPIAVGKGNSTPEGTFVVRNKVQNPPYQPQHKARSEHREAGAPDNPLGSRWIDIGNHYGVHGTIDPPSIGHDVSEGCIRMHNKDVEELYDLVVVGASKVIVKP